MIAFAKFVIEKIVNDNTVPYEDYFDGLTITVPDVLGLVSPEYHSIIGQKLLLVNWSQSYGLELQCPNLCCSTNGKLQQLRMNFSCRLGV
jgi:hypothetical protein